ncbi:MAG: HEAT repeat domain-containing protein [Gemmataceae bacterium]|nr:HEAT repeat domain-containing protein [Gemmataceae bacterium]
MPREQLQLLAGDVNRLLAAGASVAAGDEGLRKRSKALRELGQKVPVLNQIADAVERVVNAPPKQVTPALLDLVLVVRQVRASLTSAGSDGAAEAVGTSGPWSSNVPLRDLENWLETLTSSGHERTRTLKKALARPDFTDVRLIDPLHRALNSNHHGLARLVATKALPAFGKPVLPELLQAFDLPKGKAVDARRLEAICAIDPEKGADLCRQALTEGSAAVKVQGLRSLSRLKPEETEKAALILLEQKVPHEVHTAAYYALATGKSDAALEALASGFVGGSDNFHYTIENSLQRFKHPRATARLLEELDRALKDFDERQAKEKSRKAAGKGKKKVTLTKAQQKEVEKEQRQLYESQERCTRLIRCLGGRKDKKVIPALVALLGQPENEVREAAAGSLIRLGDSKGLDAVCGLMEDKTLWRYGVQAAWTMPPKERFDRLAATLADLSATKAGQRQRGELVLSFFWGELNLREQGDEDEEEQERFSEEDEDEDEDEYDDPYGDDEGEEGYWDEYDEPRHTTTQWDPRWAPALRKHLNGPNRNNIAGALAVLLGDKAIPELLKVLSASTTKNEHGVINALGFLRAKESVKPLVDLLATRPTLIYTLHNALRRIGDPSAIPRLQEILNKTKDNYRKHYIETLIEYLEEKERKAKAKA